MACCAIARRALTLAMCLSAFVSKSLSSSSVTFLSYKIPSSNTVPFV